MAAMIMTAASVQLLNLLQTLGVGGVELVEIEAELPGRARVLEPDRQREPAETRADDAGDGISGGDAGTQNLHVAAK